MRLAYIEGPIRVASRHGRDKGMFDRLRIRAKARGEPPELGYMFRIGLRRSPVSGIVACSQTRSSEAVSYKPLAFTKVNRSMAMAIHSNLGIDRNKERQRSV